MRPGPKVVPFVARFPGFERQRPPDMAAGVFRGHRGRPEKDGPGVGGPGIHPQSRPASAVHGQGHETPAVGEDKVVEPAGFPGQGRAILHLQAVREKPPPAPAEPDATGLPLGRIHAHRGREPGPGPLGKGQRAQGETGAMGGAGRIVDDEPRIGQAQLVGLGRAAGHGKVGQERVEVTQPGGRARVRAHIAIRDEELAGPRQAEARPVPDQGGGPGQAPGVAVISAQHRVHGLVDKGIFPQERQDAPVRQPDHGGLA